MPHETVSTDVNEFCCDVERGRLLDGEKPALLIDVQADVRSLLTSAQVRADLLHKSLNNWCCVTEAEVNAWDVATTLEPMADELNLLLEALAKRLDSTDLGRKRTVAR